MVDVLVPPEAAESVYPLQFNSESDGPELCDFHQIGIAADKRWG
jgi:hypothetical protein